jgi:hypothetical protein
LLKLIASADADATAVSHAHGAIVIGDIRVQVAPGRVDSERIYCDAVNRRRGVLMAALNQWHQTWWGLVLIALAAMALVAVVVTLLVGPGV